MAPTITLYLHIGTGKSGSSAIQRFLVLNRQTLEARGLLVPGRDLSADGAGVDAHVDYFAAGIGGEGFADEVRGRVLGLREAAERRGCRAIVISAENLMNPQGFWRLFADCRHDVDVEIVAYVRRQDDFMISAWQQWHLKHFDSFDDYRRSIGGVIDWHDQLDPWNRCYRRDRMHVRRYDRRRLVDGDVVADFCSVLDLEPSGFVPAGVTNPSVDERYNELAHRFRHELFDSVHDNRFYTFLLDELGESAYKRYAGSALLTLEQRQRILAEHADANRRLRAEYFDDLGPHEPVFDEPTDADVHRPTAPPIDDATAEHLVERFRRWLNARR